MPTLLVVEVASQRLALPAGSVEAVLRMVALAPLHGAAPCVEGVLDLHGELVPVLGLRARLALPAQTARPEDHLVVVRGAKGRAALRVDRVVEVVSAGAAPYAVAGAWSAASTLAAGAAHLPEGVAIVQQLDELLAPLFAAPACEDGTSVAAVGAPSLGR